MIGDFIQIAMGILSLLSPFIEVDGKKEISFRKLLIEVVVISSVVTIGKRVYSAATGNDSKSSLSAETSVASAPSEETSLPIESTTEEPETTTMDTDPTIIEVDPGDVLTIGTYAGKSLDWKVLDVSGNKAFLLSTKAIKETEYHNVKEVTVTWGECSLRKWLNSSFLTTAFSKNEQAAILTTTVDNGADQ